MFTWIRHQSRVLLGIGAMFYYKLKIWAEASIVTVFLVSLAGVTGKKGKGSRLKDSQTYG